MDRRQFMPRYTTEKAVHVDSGLIKLTNIPRAPRAPPRTAPPILPARNPKRLGLPPRSPEKVAEIWDPKLGAYIPRQPEGGFAPASKKAASKPATSNPIQRSVSTSIFQNTPPSASALDRRETVGRSLHQEIKNLRQSCIDLQSDDVFEADRPSTPPRRSASAASLRSPMRNFSLPTYSPASKQKPAPPRPLRRARSRSVNLGPVAEASELPDLPARRESPKGVAVSFRAEDEPEFDHAVTTPLPESTATTPESETGLKEVNSPAPFLESELAATFQLPESTTTTPSIETETETEPEQTIKQTAAVLEPKSSEGTCKCCGSNRKVLAMNPTCCIDRVEEKGKMCFRCWSDRLSEGVSKHERKDWLCCVLCGKELVLGDAKRLASRGTILRYRVKIATSRIRASLPSGADNKVEGGVMWVM